MKVIDLPKDQYQKITKPHCSHINAGFGSDISIKDLALTIKDVVGYNGDIRFNPLKPDGTPKKLLDTSLLMSQGWKPNIDLRNGLLTTYDWFIKNRQTLRF